MLIIRKDSIILGGRIFLNNQRSIDPWFVTGFADGEGCFEVNIRQKAKCRLGWTVQLAFEIVLHQKDEIVLNQIQTFFGNVGTVRKHQTRNCSVYSVTSFSDIMSKIIPHFAEYKLITQKGADFILFEKVAYIIQEKEHLTNSGLQKILNHRASINLGLS